MFLGFFEFLKNILNIVKNLIKKIIKIKQVATYSFIGQKKVARVQRQMRAR